MRRFAMHDASLFCHLLNDEVECEALDPVTVDGHERNQFVFFSHGIRKTIQQDPTTGRVLQITARGHGPSMAVAPLTVEFTAFDEIDGLTLPTVTRQLVDGKPPEDGTAKWVYVVNGTTPDSVFAPPEK